MNLSRTINFILILAGGLIALSAQAGEDQNQYVLIGGIIILMLGIYRTSRNIPSKNDISDQENDSEQKDV